MKKISVIIPVFNSEAFIRPCIQSLIAQTFQAWEALVIDDGSTDRSLEVCEELGRTDDRIKVYHQENKGASAARNYGLDIAEGEYIYFLDSDDAIHPLLFEEMIRQVEKHHVEMAFCNYAKMDDWKLTAALKEISAQDERPQWQIAEGVEAERWFHIDHAAALRGIGGMVTRDCIGTLRFEENLLYGEDTIFKYFLFCKQVRTAYAPQQWYYYRTNLKSLTNRMEPMLSDVYSEKTIRIRDNEYQKERMKYALIWETVLSSEFRIRYRNCKKKGDKDRCARIREAALVECGHPLFQSVNLIHKSLFHLCFKFYPLYVPAGWAADLVWWLKERSGKNR